MNADVIKDFLISLGFQVDDSGAKKFNATLTSVTLSAVKAGAAIEATALSVVAFTAKIASGLDNLYWMSQRTGATVAGIQQIGYAVSQLGGTIDGARGALEGLSRFMRNNPGAEGFLNRLGVQTRDAKGNMRDMASVFTSVGDKLRDMPYYRANMFAQMMGIDENTLMAMRRGVGQFSAQYTAMAKAIGYNADVAAVSSNRFMTSLRTFGQMAGMARDKIGSNLAEGLSGSIDTLRKQIVDNFPKIEQSVTSGVKGLLWMADVIGHLVYRLIQLTGDIIDWWRSLDKQTRQVIEVLGALAIAWRLLNTAFATSPIGRVIMLGAALLSLIDDYKTWKEGGQSLIDWSKWEPGIKYATTAVKGLGKDFGTLYDKIKALGGAFADAVMHLLELINIDTSKFSGRWLFDQIIESARSSIKIIGSLVDVLRKIISGDFSGAWESLKDVAVNAINSPIGQGVQAVGAGIVDKVTDFARDHLPEWAGGTPVKRPEPTKAGAALLGWMQPAMGRLEQLYRLPEGLLRSVAIAESGGNQFARSDAGAQGLFQFMPGTARDMGLRGNDVFDPMKSAQAAAKYLSQLLQANGGDLTRALASYNWGLNNVRKYGMQLMPQETRNYVPRVLSNMPGNAVPTVNQETNIHIHGVTDPAQAGKAVADQQTSVNSRFSQSLSTGPR